MNNSIDTLDSEVVTLRAGMVSYTSTSNVIKPTKISYAVNIWSYDRGNNLVTGKNAEYQNVIDIRKRERERERDQRDQRQESQWRCCSGQGGMYPRQQRTVTSQKRK